MAMQAHHEPAAYSRHHEEGVEAANHLGCAHECCEESVIIQGEAIKQGSAQGAFIMNAPISAGETRSSNEIAGELFMEPALKRLRCRSALQIHRPSLINVAPLAEEMSDRDDGKLQLRRIIGDEQTSSFVSVTKIDDSGQIIISNEEQNVAISCKAESELPADEEEEESECATPTAREQRIPESENLVCPPPPIKRKPTAFKRISTRPSAYNRANLLINPPDLHTYPECIRSLFDK